MNRILAMLLANRAVKAGRRFEVVSNEAADEATVYLYDAIVSSDADASWYGGVSAETFARDFAAIKASTIHLRINSPGGDVFGGRVMEAAIKRHSAKVFAHVDGVAASAASYVAIAADHVEMAPGAFLMVHNAWALGIGNASDLRSLAGVLEQIDASLAETYAKRTGASVEDMAALMAAETWIGAEQAVEQKFANTIAESTPKALAAWDLRALGGPAPAVEREPAPEPVQEPEPSSMPEAAAHAHYMRLQSHVERIAH